MIFKLKEDNGRVMDFTFINNVNGADPRIVRLINQRTIFSIIRKKKGITITEITRLANLSPATVKSVIDDLIKMELVAKGFVQKSTGGRKPKQYLLNLENIYVVGFELHKHYLKIGIVKLDGTIVFSDEWKLQASDQYRIVSLIENKYAKTIANANIDNDDILGIGICQPGIVDTEGKIIKKDIQLGWTEFPLGLMIQEKLNIPLFLIEESNAKLIAEIEFGDISTSDNVLYVLIGSSVDGGISGAILIKNSILTGSHGFAGEIGHSVINPDGPACNCGRIGCWEAFGNIPRMLSNINQLVPDANIRSIQELTEYLENNRTDSIELEIMIERFISVHAEGIANLIHTLNPEQIIIGGEIALLKDFFLQRLLKYLEKKVMKPFMDNTVIKLSAIDKYSAILGAASVVIQNAISITGKISTSNGRNKTCSYKMERG